MKSNRSITSLKLNFKNIDDASTKVLVEALSFNANLIYLDLGHNRIGNEGAKAVAELLKSKAGLRWLGLKSNVIDDEGLKILAEVLKGNTSLTHLDLSDNKFSSYLSYKALASALKVNDTLSSLKCESNYVADFILHLFAEALKDNWALTTFSYGFPGENYDSDLDAQLINSKLIKNLKLLNAIEGAKGALSLINHRLAASDNPAALKYPPEIMDQVVNKMRQAGLEKEITDLSNDIIPPEKPSKS